MVEKKSTTKKTVSKEAEAKEASSKASTAKKKNTGLIVGIIAAVVAIVVAIVAIVLVNATPKVVGKYVLSATIDSDGNESTTMVNLLKAFGGSYTVEFKKDKTGVFEVKSDSSIFSGLDDDDSTKSNNASTSFTYDGKKIKFEKDGETEETDYEYKDDTVKFTIDGDTLKFTREK